MLGTTYNLNYFQEAAEGADSFDVKCQAHFEKFGSVGRSTVTDIVFS